MHSASDVWVAVWSRPLVPVRQRSAAWRESHRRRHRARSAATPTNDPGAPLVRRSVGLVSMGSYCRVVLCGVHHFLLSPGHGVELVETGSVVAAVDCDVESTGPMPGVRSARAVRPTTAATTVTAPPIATTVNLMNAPGRFGMAHHPTSSRNVITPTSSAMIASASENALPIPTRASVDGADTTAATGIHCGGSRAAMGGELASSASIWLFTSSCCPVLTRRLGIWPYAARKIAPTLDGSETHMTDKSMDNRPFPEPPGTPPSGPRPGPPGPTEPRPR
jgi:hypothetical protein